MSTACNDPSARTDYTELVWDAERHCTACAGGVTVAAGDDVAWTPELLLATAVGASVMSTFLQIASEARLDVLGYVSQHRATQSADRGGVPDITVSPCITVSADDAEVARSICDRAMAVAPVVSALRRPVRFDVRIAPVPHGRDVQVEG